MHLFEAGACLSDESDTKLNYIDFCLANNSFQCTTLLYCNTMQAIAKTQCLLSTFKATTHDYFDFYTRASTPTIVLGKFYRISECIPRHAFPSKSRNLVYIVFQLQLTNQSDAPCKVRPAYKKVQKIVNWFISKAPNSLHFQRLTLKVYLSINCVMKKYTFLEIHKAYSSDIQQALVWVC